MNPNHIQTAAADIDPNKPSVPFMLPMFSSMTGGPSAQTTYMPTADDFENFFTIFCERVDPIIRILHKPTVRRLLDRVKTLGVVERSGKAKVTSPLAVLSQPGRLLNPEKWSGQVSHNLPPYAEEDISSIEYALLMAIAYATTYSLIEDDPRIEDLFHGTLADLRQKVTFSTEVAMSRVKLSATKDFTALQAFTLYIVC